MALDKNSVVCEVKSFKLAFQADVPKNIAEINEEILDSVQKNSMQAVFAYTKPGRAVTFAELARNGITDDIPEDGTVVIKVLTFDFENERLFVMEKHALIPLARLKLTVAYRKVEQALLESRDGAGAAEATTDDYTANVFIKTNEAELK